MSIFVYSIYQIWHHLYIILDINECAIEDSCDGNATCVNTVGSYNCSCIMGTEGDGFDSCEGTKNGYNPYIYLQTIKIQIHNSLYHLTAFST